MNKLLILTSYSKLELNSLTNNDITMKLPITDILAVATQRKSEMTSYLKMVMTSSFVLLNLQNSYPIV